MPEEYRERRWPGMLSRTGCCGYSKRRRATPGRGPSMPSTPSGVAATSWSTARRRRATAMRSWRLPLRVRPQRRSSRSGGRREVGRADRRGDGGRLRVRRTQDPDPDDRRAGDAGPYGFKGPVMARHRRVTPPSASGTPSPSSPRSPDSSRSPGPGQSARGLLPSPEPGLPGERSLGSGGAAIRSAARARWHTRPPQVVAVRGQPLRKSGRTGRRSLRVGQAGRPWPRTRPG